MIALSDPSAKRALWLNRMVRRIWHDFLIFLEIIGLRRGDKADQAVQVARLKLYHAEFRKLLSANNSFLETIADLEHKLLNREFIDRTYVKRKTLRAIADIHTMVETINVISDARYPSLRAALDRITAALIEGIEGSAGFITAELVMDISTIRKSHADLTGGKMTNLGEIRNTLDLPTPEGFVITTEGFRMLLEEGGIRSWIQDREMELLSRPDVEKLSSSLQQRILQVHVPLRLKEAIFNSYDRLTVRIGLTPSLAVRSSALGEDSDFSFAGQFLSLLNIGREGLLNAYLRVTASLYSPEAIHYCLLHPEQLLTSSKSLVFTWN